MTNTAERTDVIIAGGGIAGLALGIVLGQAGFTVTLVEPRSPAPLAKTGRTGRTVALMDRSVNIIKATGVWDHLEAHSAALKSMTIVDDSLPEQIEAAFYAHDIGLEAFGFNVPNALLRAALHDRIQAIPAVTLYQDHITDIETKAHAVHATLNSGAEIKGTVLIGADGRKSTVRKLAGIETRTKPYDQVAITALINHSRPHNNTAVEFHKPAGPLALVPLPDHCASIVWVERPKKAQALLALKKQEFTDALQAAMHDRLGGITLETGPEHWPLCSVQAKKLTAPRTALIAEAAHVMSPVTAQGLNLSLRDVATLAEVLTDARRAGLDIGAGTILKNYEKRREPDVNTRVFGVDGMNTVISQDIKLIKGMRRFGLKTIDRITPLKKLAMRQGLAPNIDESRLSRGLPL